MKIHPLLDHSESVFALAEWMFREWYEPMGDSYDDALQTLVGRMNRFSLPMSFIAQEENQPVGMVSLIRDTLEEGHGAPCLAGLFVVEERRGRGIGTRLCRWAMHRASHLGLPALTLYTADRQTFYGGLGWFPFGDATSDGCVRMRSRFDQETASGVGARSI